MEFLVVIQHGHIEDVQRALANRAMVTPLRPIETVVSVNLTRTDLVAQIESEGGYQTGLEVESMLMASPYVVRLVTSTMRVTNE